MTEKMTEKTTEKMAEKPNILFLMTDQHRIDTLGCYGNDIVRTPNLDRIAGDGARLDRCYTPTAICTPARASLLTGLHPFRHQLLANYEWNSGGREELPDGLPILSRELRSAGYNVGHVGKWHVGRDRGPEYYGHDAEHLPGAVNGTNLPSYLNWLDRTGQVKPQVQDAAHGVLPDGSPGHLIAGRLDQPTEASFEQFLTDRALDTLRGYVSDHQDSGKPFYLACQYFGPHLPYLVPDKYYDMYDPADVILPASMAETFVGKPEVQERYNEYWSADHFSADEWRKLIAAYWGYVTMIDDSDRQAARRPGRCRALCEHGDHVHSRPRRIHRCPPSQRQGTRDVRGHLPDSGSHTRAGGRTDRCRAVHLTHRLHRHDP